MGYLDLLSFKMNVKIPISAAIDRFDNPGGAWRDEVSRDCDDALRPIDSRSAVQYCISNDLI